MKRTTITLSDELAGALEREAHRRRISISQVTREALSAHLGFSGEERRKLPFAALGRSGHRTTARDIEEILASEWDRARDR
jgi:predicted transcriptional regulator